MAKDSKEAQKAAAEAEAAAAAKKQAGLDAVLASLQQAKKVGGWQGDQGVAPARNATAALSCRCTRLQVACGACLQACTLCDSCQICHACASAGRRQLLALQRLCPLTASQVTVLDKSRAHWKDFKKTDDTIEEELEMHKRSGDQVWPGGWLAVGSKGSNWLLVGAASWCQLCGCCFSDAAASRSLIAAHHAHVSYPHPGLTPCPSLLLSRLPPLPAVPGQAGLPQGSGAARVREGARSAPGLRCAQPRAPLMLALAAAGQCLPAQVAALPCCAVIAAAKLLRARERV